MGIDAGAATIRIPAVMATLAAVAAFLVLAHLGFSIAADRAGIGDLRGRRLFDLGEDANVPTWFATLLLLSCAALLALVSQARRSLASGRARSWGVLAVLFFYLSLDEAAMIHETVQVVLRLGLEPGGALYAALSTVFPALLVVAGLAAAIGVLRSVPRRTARLLIASAVVFVAGGLGFDLVGEVYRNAGGERVWIVGAVDAAEESGEMAGLLLFLYALLDHVKHDVGPLRLRVS